MFRLTVLRCYQMAVWNNKLHQLCLMHVPQKVLHLLQLHGDHILAHEILCGLPLLFLVFWKPVNVLQFQDIQHLSFFSTIMLIIIACNVFYFVQLVKFWIFGMMRRLTTFNTLARWASSVILSSLVILVKPRFSVGMCCCIIKTFTVSS